MLFLLSGCALLTSELAPKLVPKLAGSVDSDHPRIMIGSVLNCNKLTYYVSPVYPKVAKKKRIQGTVSLLAVITRQGELRNLEVLKGDPLLIPAALKAVKQWRYTPCLLNSEPVNVIAFLDLSFNLTQ